jgi:hypothetical protein
MKSSSNPKNVSVDQIAMSNVGICPGLIHHQRQFSAFDGTTGSSGRF